MPTRLIREGIISSERVDQLDAGGEVFYRRLLNKVDDHGLYDGRPSILRANLFPLRVDRVREADISRWMAACQKAGLIVLYENGGKPYLMVLNTEWDKRSKPKYPLPPESIPKQLLTDPNTSTVVRSRISLPVVESSRFAEFWLAYPKKLQKPQCMAKWKSRNLDALADTILPHVLAMAKSDQLLRESGKYCPNPMTYLNQDRWEQGIDKPQRSDGLAL